ncbi:MAG: 16S rRNA (cytosine(1402)-N(4))-methyltransferase RsmH [Treponema sp.]|jgi:16S rRNA (cytosine1402-N4)-methyltransferase|nr:16S rRNA (cytosine(1402)-N(4))-methyltransferase RsmH [Treponema sp.]
MEAFHTPVLLEETIEYLAPRGDGELMVDATLGEGGHSEAFLERFPGLSIIGVDADPFIQERAKKRLEKFGSRMSFYSGWSDDFFRNFGGRPNTVLFDLGISMYHYEQSGRGFSFRKDEYLDMRIDPGRGKTAADLVASLSEERFADMLWNNAGERFSRRIARSVAAAKKSGAVTTTGALAECVLSAVPAVYRRGPVHPATKTFQALRIEVNGELERLPRLLEKALDVLQSGGRMGVISFHSGEDRVVKVFLRGKSRDCTCPPSEPICRCGGKRTVTLLTRRAVSAGEEEVRRNPPSRSARLRVAEKASGTASLPPSKAGA